MKKVYKIKIKLLSPLHINGGVDPDSMRITVMSGGKPYVPATLVKGIVRSNFKVLANTFLDSSDITDYFFGKGGFQRSRVIFDDLETEQELLTETRTNVSINRYTRKVNDSALVNTQTVSRYDTDGNSVVFEGEMTVYYTPEEYLKYENFILQSLRMITAIGSGKSRGLGFVEVSADEEG